MNEVDVRIVLAENRGIDAYKGDLQFEIIPPDAVSTDISFAFFSNKCEYKKCKRFARALNPFGEWNLESDGPSRLQIP